MKSWKTTVGGIVAALGAGLSAASAAGGLPPWLGAIGGGCTAFGIAMLGLAARDNNVTSEQAGAGASKP